MALTYPATIDAGTSASAAEVQSMFDAIKTYVDALPTAAGGTFQTSHSWTLEGAVSAARYINPIRIPKGSAQTVQLTKVWYRLNNGAVGLTATFKLQINGVDATGFTAITTPTTTAYAATDPANITLSDGDYIAPICTAVAGAPENLSISVVLEHVV